MPLDDAGVLAALARMLSAGPLDHLPKRRGDLEVMLALACAPFESQRTYREDEVNDRLREWLARFTAPPALDHVTIRRYLVDAQYVLRNAPGTAYRLNVAKLDAELTGSAQRIDPGRVLIELREARERRKLERGGGA